MELIEIQDLEAGEIKLFYKYNEPELFHYKEPRIGYFLAESPNVIERALKAGYEPVSFLVESDLLEKAKEFGNVYSLEIPCYVGKKELLKNIPGFSMTRGMLALMNRREPSSCETVLKDARRIAILENVMNPSNVGAIFRAAAALGMDAVLLTDRCSDPLYRRAARVSMGTVFQIPWTFLPESEEGVPFSDIKKAGFQSVAMALCEDSYSMDAEELKKVKKLAVILGTESEGLRPETIKNADYRVKIPMYHEVDSLNVASAAAVAFWELTKN